MVKVFSIISKNLKVVSRSWIYVILLIILPTTLVLATSSLLDSVNLSNVKIGMVSNSNDLPIRLMLGDARFYEYQSLDECKNSLKKHTIPVCIDFIERFNSTDVNVYFDNSKFLLSQYARSYVTKRVIEGQLSTFEITLEDVLLRMTAIAASVDLARDELQTSYEELLKQEDRLLEYQENFSRINSDFQRTYADVKLLEPAMRQNIQSYKEIKEFLGTNLSEMKKQNEQLRKDINTIKPILQVALPASQYNEIAARLDALLLTTTTIENNLDALNSTVYVDDPDKLLTDYDTAMRNLDEMNTLLQQMDEQLDENIMLVEQNKIKIVEILDNIESNKKEIEEIYGKIKDASSHQVTFYEAFQLPEKTSSLYFPLLFLMIIAFTSIILSNMFIIDQTHKPSYVREMITPTFDITFLLGDFIVCIFIAVFQISMLFIIGQFIFDLNILNNFFYLAGISLLVSSIFILIGMSIGYLIRSRHLSILFSTFLLLFFMVFSDLLIPRELTGFFVRFFSGLNPFVIGNNLVFDVMIFSNRSSDSLFYIILLVIALFSMFIFAYLSKKIGKYKLLKE